MRKWRKIIIDIHNQNKKNKPINWDSSSNWNVAFYFFLCCAAFFLICKISDGPIALYWSVRRQTPLNQWGWEGWAVTVIVMSYVWLHRRFAKDALMCARILMARILK